MKRDVDFIRDLLLEAEADDGPYFTAPLSLSPSAEAQKRHVHAVLLTDAGFFAEVNDGMFRLTNQGHDYL